MSISEKIKAEIARGLDVPFSKVTDNASFKVDLEADSIDLLDLIMLFEDEYSLDIPNRDIEKLQTVRDAINYLEKAIKNG